MTLIETENGWRGKGADIEFYPIGGPALPSVSKIVSALSDEQLYQDFTRKTRRSLLGTSVLLLLIFVLGDPQGSLSFGGLSWKLQPYLANLLRVHPIYFVSAVAFIYSLLQWREYSKNDHQAVLNRRHTELGRVRSDLEKQIERGEMSIQALDDWLAKHAAERSVSTRAEYDGCLAQLPEKLLSSGQIPKGHLRLSDIDGRTGEGPGRAYAGLRKTVKDHRAQQQGGQTKVRDVLQELQDRDGQGVWANYNRRLFWEFKFPWWVAGLAFLLFMARLVFELVCK